MTFFQLSQRCSCCLAVIFLVTAANSSTDAQERPANTPNEVADPTNTSDPNIAEPLFEDATSKSDPSTIKSKTPKTTLSQRINNTFENSVTDPSGKTSGNSGKGSVTRDPAGLNNPLQSSRSSRQQVTQSNNGTNSLAENSVPSTAAESLVIVRLKNCDAQSAAAVLSQLMDDLKVVAEPRINAIVIRGESKAVIDEARQLLQKLDGAQLDELKPHVSAQPKRINAADELNSALNQADVRAKDIATLLRKAGQAKARNYGFPNESKPKAANNSDEMPTERNALRQRLRREVEAAFNARQQLQLVQVQRLREQLARTEQLIRSRERIKNKIIEHRVEELLDPTIRWENLDNDRTASTSTSNGNAPVGLGVLNASPNKSKAQHSVNGASDAAESIYNERIRRFRFKLEKVKIEDDVETAQMFYLRYTSPDRPPLKGVWGEVESNSIVILAPPEAEQDIRDELARWEGETIGIPLSTFDEGTLEADLRQLEAERRYTIQKMSSIRVDIVELDVNSDSDTASKEKLKELSGQLSKLEKQLEQVDRKIQIVGDGISQRDISTPSTVAENQPNAFSSLAVGQHVYVSGMNGTLLLGKITGLNRSLILNDGNKASGLIQTDLPHSADGSPRALRDQQNQVLGVEVMVRAAKGVTFFIPIAQQRVSLVRQNASAQWGLPQAQPGSPISDTTALLRKATEFRRTIGQLKEDIAIFENVIKHNPKHDNIGGLTKQMENSKAELAIQRAELSALTRLLELEVESASETEKSTRELLERWVDAESSTESLANARRSANVATQRLKQARTILEMFQSIDPPVASAEETATATVTTQVETNLVRIVTQPHTAVDVAVKRGLKYLAASSEPARELNGSWSVKSIGSGDEKNPISRNFDRYEWHFDAAKKTLRTNVLAKDGKGSTSENRYVIDASSAPNRLTVYGGNMLLQTIYEVDGDELKVAMFGKAEQERPTSFTAKSKSAGPLMVFTMKRMGK